MKGLWCDMEEIRRIRLIAMDVDGVLTDGEIIYGNNGQELKAFNAQDGMGITLARRVGLYVALVTGRSSEAVRRRAEELGITSFRQGIANKRESMESILQELGVSREETAFIGDDLNDLSVMTWVGLPVAVANAALEVKQAAAFCTQASGGRGAVREVIERILKEQGLWEKVLAEVAAGARARQ